MPKETTPSSYKTSIPKQALVLYQYHLVASMKAGQNYAQIKTDAKANALAHRKPGKIGQMLASVEEIFLAGGGGAGRALPGAFKAAMEYGLDLDKVKVVCGTSVGTIVALGIALNLTVDQMREELDNLPTDSFQDWELFESIANFNERWGWCKGEAMPACFRDLIEKHSHGKLKDPTFQELYDAGFTKELRVVTTNLDKQDITVFSHKTTPHKKVADAVALSCSVPILFPPRWHVSADGRRELHTDGGVIKNYPFGVGSDSKVPLEKQLGFIFVNGATAKSLDCDHKPTINTFIQYLAALLSAIVFQHPLTLPEPVKRRTVAIQVHHNPFEFSPNEEQQKMLDKAGANGVRSLIQQLIKYQGLHGDLSQVVDDEQAFTPKLRPA